MGRNKSTMKYCREEKGRERTRLLEGEGGREWMGENKVIGR